jgi:three-Cys-motif partner protein
MSLDFKEDAICLSGLTGSKLKCQIIGEYYPFWWGITSGGERKGYGWPTTIIELDAATGEVYIEDTKETTLGSSGHALELKCSNPNTQKLKIILVEKDKNCYSHLKHVINRRWASVDIKLAEGSDYNNKQNIFLLNEELDKALDIIERISLGNSLFFFDPLRSVKYQAIEKVTNKRIRTYYREGTELIIFVFTSDWFLGRDDFTALPTTLDTASWSTKEHETVCEADALFGDKKWRDQILNSNPIDERETKFVELYRYRLHKWFRYVLPLPFNPKNKQIYHLIICSNYEAGIRATRDFYSKWTGNPKYLPSNDIAYRQFKALHHELFLGLTGNQRPSYWKMLWEIIKDHEEGICDFLCRDLINVENDNNNRQKILKWLAEKGYLKTFYVDNAWNAQITQYQLNWSQIGEKLNIQPPPSLNPLSLKPLSLKEISQ